MYVDGTLGLYRPVSHAGNLQFVCLNGTELVDETKLRACRRGSPAGHGLADADKGIARWIEVALATRQ
jgi:hypothetical protein